MTAWTWPHLDKAPGIFYSDSLAPTRALWSAWRIPGAVGSGRPPGPRNWQWSATVVLAVAALEAGLEELLLAAHARRSAVEGQSLVRADRRYLVEDVLQAPNARKIARTLFSSFGIQLETPARLAPVCDFTARKKIVAKAGSGRGTPSKSPDTWPDLAKWLDAVLFVRHAVAHGDVAKQSSFPETGKGVLWVPLQQAGWSVQQPHVLTALRTVVATYNSVAVALESSFGSPVRTALRAPDEVFGYPT